MKDKYLLQKQILKSIPADEKKIWNTLTTLPVEQKWLMWDLIQKSNKEGLYIFEKDIKQLQFLLSKGLISINMLYKSQSKEVSIFVLRDAPYLLRMLRNHAKKRI